MINYDMEYFDPVRLPDPTDFPGRYNTSAYIISYGELNFNYDVEIIEILSPTDKDMLSRMNPTCSSPELIIRNRGSEIINNIDVKYEINGQEHTYKWIGSLSYGERDTLIIPFVTWENNDEGNYISFLLENPNGVPDEYPSNNDAYATFDPVEELYDEMILEFKTVNYDAYDAQSPYRYYIFDNNFDIVESRTTTANSYKYTDTLRLPNGCYTFYFENRYGYGLSYWPLDRLSSGYLNFKKGNATLKTFNPDFGNSIYMQFIVKDHPEISTLNKIDTLDMGEVNLGEKTTKKVTIVAANDEPVIIDEIDIKLGSIKGFNIINTTPEFKEGMVLTKNEGIELEIEFEGKFAGTQTSDIEIKAENTFLPINRIPIKGISVDPSNVNSNSDYISDLQVLYDKNLNPVIKIYSNQIQMSDIYIRDIFGNKVQEIYRGVVNVGENDYHFDSNGLSNGIYFVTFSTENLILREKLIISK
jgi:hypothetical protein